MHPMSWHKREAMEVVEMKAAIESNLTQDTVSVSLSEAMEVVEMDAKARERACGVREL